MKWDEELRVEMIGTRRPGFSPIVAAVLDKLVPWSFSPESTVGRQEGRGRGERRHSGEGR